MHWNLASAQNVADDVAVDVGQTALDAVVVKGEAFVVDAQKMQDRCVHVVRGDRVFDG